MRYIKTASRITIILLLIAVGSRPVYAERDDSHKKPYCTTKSPCAVKLILPEKTKEDREKEEQERAIKAAYDKGILDALQEQTAFTGRLVYVGWFQFAVFLFQLGVFACQARWMRDTVREMELGTQATIKAANAADLNARAAVGTELPIIRFIPVDLVSMNAPLSPDNPYGGTVGAGIPSKHSAIGRFGTRNHGRTDAFPEIFRVGWKVAPQLTGEPVYTHTEKVSHALVIKHDPYEGVTFDYHYGINLTDEEIKAIGDGASWLWVYGSLKYTDFLNEPREARFCWRLADRSGSYKTFYFEFASDGDPPKAYINADYQKEAR